MPYPKPETGTSGAIEGVHYHRIGGRVFPIVRGGATEPPPTPDPGTPAPTPEPTEPAPSASAAKPDDQPKPGEKLKEPIKLPDDHPLVKAYADTKAKLRKREDAELDEQQRLARDLEEATKRGGDLEAENARLRAAITYKLDEADLDLLGSGTAEEIDARAKRLAERLAPAGRRPQPDPTQGNRDNEARLDVKALVDSIPSTT